MSGNLHSPGFRWKPILFGIRSTRQRAQTRGFAGRTSMSLKRILYSTAAVIGLAAMAVSPADAQGQAQPSVMVAIDNDDIGGVVTGASGPEAGVWVIAETT